MSANGHENDSGCKDIHVFVYYFSFRIISFQLNFIMQRIDCL